MNFLSSLRIGLLAALLFGSTALALHAQTITTFDVPDSTATLPVGINFWGQIVGSYVTTTQDHCGYGRRGFVRERDGTTAAFDVFVPNDCMRVFPTAINFAGRVTGYVIDLNCTDCADSFIRENDGALTVFGLPNMAPDALAVAPAARINYVEGASATGINDVGQVVGVAAGPGYYWGFVRQPDGTFIQFFYPPIGFPNLVPQAINDLGQVTGYANAGAGYQGFLRKRSGRIIIFDPPDSTGTYPKDINLRNQITGSYTGADGLSHGFLRKSNTSIVTFDPPASVGTQVNAINFEGQIVGYYVDSLGISHSFIRQRNGSMTTFDVPGIGVSGTFAQDINCLGEITGYYTDASGTHGFVRSPSR